MAQINLFLVIDTKRPNLNASTAGDYTFPELAQGDTTTLAITLLTFGINQFSFTKIRASQYSVRLGLFTSAGVLLSYIPSGSFVRDDVAQTFTAVFPLNTANIDTAVTAAAGDVLNNILQIEITEIATGAVTTVYTNKTVKILKDYLTNALAAVAAGETTASQGWVSAGFVKNYEDTPGVRIRQSIGNKFFRCWMDDDGKEQSEPYVPV